MRIKLFTQAVLVTLVCLAASGLLRADTNYSYTGGTVTISFTTTLTGIQVDNLAPGTDILGTVSTSVITAPVPGSDTAGFPVGVNNTEPPPSVFQIGTDAFGNITSWNITESVFASYPAFSGENPTDFYCRYSLNVNNGGNSETLTQDNDAGFCPASGNTGVAGTFGAPVSTDGPTAPEPSSLGLFAGGLVGAMAFAQRIKRS